MVSLDPRVCPLCGAEDFEIQSEESIRGTCGVWVLDEETMQWDGYTEVDWNSQRTEFSYCASCKARLQNEWQEAITTALCPKQTTEEIGRTGP
jgi:hypothetical protein